MTVILDNIDYDYSDLVGVWLSQFCWVSSNPCGQVESKPSVDGMFFFPHLTGFTLYRETFHLPHMLDKILKIPTKK